MECKSQSAMEYLMTYGWAILIIAVVLGVLFQLGIFSGSSLTPKAQPGSCEVLRTVAATSLEGLCQGQLPQFVAQFNGQTSWVSIPTLMQPQSHSFIAWMESSSYTAYDPLFFVLGQWNARVLVHGTIQLSRDGGGGVDSGVTPNPNQWYEVAITINSIKVASIYVNGVLKATGTPPSQTENWNGGAFVGFDQYNNWYFNGQLADIQIYNTTLNGNEISASYLEGVGGAPVQLQNLVGWWPLNGNLNDYSGNNNNGSEFAGNQISFNGTWTSSYTTP